MLSRLQSASVPWKPEHNRNFSGNVLFYGHILLSVLLLRDGLPHFLSNAMLDRTNRLIRQRRAAKGCRAMPSSDENYKSFWVELMSPHQKQCWELIRFWSRCVCDGCHQRGQVTTLSRRCALRWRRRGMIELALCHMPGRLRHLWYVRLCLNLFWTNCSWSRRDEAVMWSASLWIVLLCSLTELGSGVCSRFQEEKSTIKFGSQLQEEKSTIKFAVASRNLDSSEYSDTFSFFPYVFTKHNTQMYSTIKSCKKSRKILVSASSRGL